MENQESINTLTQEQLYDFQYVDVFIVYVKSKFEAKRVQQKFNKMGFKHQEKDWINDKYDCYYIAQILISNDFRNGRRHQVWGRDEVKNSKYFNHSLLSYKQFMLI